MKNRALSLLLPALFTALAGCGAAARKPHAVEKVTGEHTRVVWMRQIKGAEGSDPFGYEANFQLMAFDSRDGGKPRVLLPGPVSCRKPLLSADGQTVVYTDLPKGVIHRIPFAGGTPVRLAAGNATELWRDPAGVDWVYFSPEFKPNSTRDGKSLHRFPLHDPARVEVVWDATPVTPDNFMLSADGKTAAGLFPWSAAGILNLEKKLYRRVGTGCWTAMCPDNSYRLWIFDGAHENLLVRPFQSATATPIRINKHPALAKRPVYHPRWSNHPQLFIFTGPYQGGQNGIDKGGKGIDLYIGRFNEEFTAIGEPFELTNDDPADFFPDLWVDGGEKAGTFEPPVPMSTALDAGKSSLPELEKALQLRWMNQKENDWRDPVSGATRIFNFTARGHAVPGRFHDMLLSGGRFVSEFDTTPVAKAFQASGAFTLEMTLTPRPRRIDVVGVPFLWGASFDEVNVSIAQYDGSYYIRLRTDTRPVSQRHDIQIAAIPAGDRPHHLVVSYSEGRLSTWLNGELQSEFADVSGTLRTWAAHPIQLGSQADGKMRWPGRIEGVRLFAGAIHQSEATLLWQEAKARIGNRAPLTPLVVKATLVESVMTSSPQSILPYKRLLFDSVYKVSEVLSGAGARAGDEILVTRWGILDGTVLPGLPKPGAVETLALEPIADHPEMEGERIDGSDRLELESFHLPLD